MTGQIELYHRQMCQQSAKVRRFIDANKLGAKIKCHDTDSQDWARQQLKTMSGSEAVPTLVVDEKPIQGAELILAWLQANMIEKTVA